MTDFNNLYVPGIKPDYPSAFGFDKHFTFGLSRLVWTPFGLRRE
jgi:hypothetical protein